jgi:hypothetical protein
MYVQLDADYYDHPKTLHLVSLIGTEGDVYPPRLWTWAIKYAKKGVLRSTSMIEVACRWRGESGKLAAAMMAAGFVEMDGLTIHGWMERTGHDLEVYELKKERLRERRRNFPGTFRERSRTVTEQFPEHSGNVPEQFQECSALTELSDLNGTERNGAEGVPTVSQPPKEPKSTPMGMLLGLAERARIPNAETTLRKYLDAWKARSDHTRVEQILTDPWSVGKTVNEIQDHFFPKQKAQEHAFVPAKPKCANCGGSGKVAGAVENGAVTLVACRRCANARG